MPMKESEFSTILIQYIVYKTGPKIRLFSITAYAQRQKSLHTAFSTRLYCIGARPIVTCSGLLLSAAACISVCCSISF